MQKDKPFLTIDEQMGLLRSRGMIVSDEDRSFLIREGYYSLVNGYKDAFIDRQRSSEAGDDRFRPGTSLRHLRLLFDLDRLLREETFPLLVRAETTFRTSLAYSFSDKNRGHDSYLDPDSYCERSRYHNRGRYERDKAELLRRLKRAHDNGIGHPPIDHYLSNYGHVPLWVLVNVLTFGNTSHLFALSTDAVRNETCRLISEVQGSGRIGTEHLRKSVSTLVAFRNICAHDDRLYRARVGKHGERTFADMIDALRVMVDPEDIEQYETRVADIIGIFDEVPEIQHEVLNGMFVEIVDGSIRRTAKVG